MFVLEDAAGGPPTEFYSFGEVAAELGCDVSLLRDAIESTPTRRNGKPLTIPEVKKLAANRPPDLTTGFQALWLADYKRLVVHGHVTNEACERPGFPGVVLYDEAVREYADSGALFQMLLIRLHIPILVVRCLSSTGRDYARAHLTWLADEETVPAGITGPAVHQWRALQRHKREAAEERAADARR